MNLEALSARLRPRTPGEAMDLGVCLVREFSGVVLIPWLLLVGPIVGVILWSQPNLLGVFLVWWLMPLFARIPLFVLSRALFGDVPRLGRVLREVRRLFARYLVWPLTLGRVSPTWVCQLPVSELEQQRGRSYRQRCRVLGQDQESIVWGLTAMSGVLVLCVWLGAVVAAGSLLEILQGSLAQSFDYDEVSGTFKIPPWAYVLLGVSVAVVTPVHVASGFCLYLNRRLHLEGWDIELTFRRLAQRIRDTRAPAVNVLAPFLLSLVTLHGVVSSQDRPRPDSSSQAVTLQAEAQDPQVVIQRVLEHRDFGGERVVSRWEFVGNSPSFSGGMIPGIGGVAEVLWILMWAFAILVVLWALYKVVQSFGWGAGKGRGRASGGPPAEVMGMDVRPESLPDDISVEAWRLWMAGDAVGCLGLLYRGSLAILIHEMHVDIRRSFTESDCLRAVGDTCAVPMSQYFGGLTSAWQSCAYGHRVPVESAARLLCDSWPDHFRGDA